MCVGGGRAMRKFLKRADRRFHARRGERPYRFIQNRSRASVTALKATQRQSSPKINFGEIFWLVRFWTFATISGVKRNPFMVAEV